MIDRVVKTFWMALVAVVAGCGGVEELGPMSEEEAKKAAEKGQQEMKKGMEEQMKYVPKGAKPPEIPAPSN